MGTRAALVVFGDARTVPRDGVPDRSAAEAVVRALRPGCTVEPVEDGVLADDLCPPDGFTYVAVFPGATIVCDRELATVPVAEHVLEYADDRPLVVFAQDSGLLAFAEWAADGTLLRSHAGSHDKRELAGAVAAEMVGFTAESAPGVLLHGFRVTAQGGPKRETATDTAIAQGVPSETASARRTV
ncbi:DUF6928 family protein [Lentzea sp.]|uniref:DUF6928 family protein n=1 Tax=Lentzea sp. TaxID=56099 RepID=UPI002ECFC912